MNFEQKKIEEPKKLGIPEIKYVGLDPKLCLERGDAEFRVLQQFTSDLQENYSRKLDEAIEKYSEETGKISSEMKDYLQKKDMLGLRISIIHPSQAVHQAKSFNIPYYTQGMSNLEADFSDKFLINIQLPIPLAQFWYRSDRKPLPEQSEKEHQEIKWGKIYKNLSGSLWKTIDHYNNELPHVYKLQRKNGLGEHNKNTFYYLFSFRYNSDMAQIEQQLSEIQTSVDTGNTPTTQQSKILESIKTLIQEKDDSNVDLSKLQKKFNEIENKIRTIELERESALKKEEIDNICVKGIDAMTQEEKKQVYDYCFDKSLMHDIFGDLPTEDQTDPLTKIQRDTFELLRPEFEDIL